MESKKLNALLQGVIASLTDEQKKEANTCKDLNELAAYLGKQGVELPDELLEAAAGGGGQGWEKVCKQCGVNKITPVYGRAYQLGLCLPCYSKYPGI